MQTIAERDSDKELASNRKVQPISQSVGWLSMLEEHNAISYGYWRLVDNESLKMIQGQGVVDEALRTRFSELAEVAIRSKQHHSCVLTSPTLSILIAEPIPGSDSDCLCVQFYCEAGELNVNAVEQRSAVVANIVASMQTAFPFLLPSPSSPDALPSWTELARITKQKLQGSLARKTSRPKPLVAMLLCIVGMGLVPWQHSIRCKVVCEPVVRRFVAAPFDGRLLQSHVLVGQQVQKGELLATLDGGELRSRLASVRAKLSQAEQRELAALSSGDHSKAGFERMEVEHLRRESELLERRHASLEIRSPIDGVVVTGDLKKAEGAPLSVGDNLFEIASLDQLIAEVAIPEQDILFVKDGMRLAITFDAVPGSSRHSTISKIHLRSEIRNDTSVFIAEACIPNQENLLRPGMNANAVIEAGYKTIGWQLLRRPYNAVREWIGW